MKTKQLKQKFRQFPLQSRAGMTLMEVVISLAITGLAVGGIVTGYTFCSTSAEKAALSLAASARAMERLEETRNATWDMSAGTDQLVGANFPSKVVTLDLSGSGTAITPATIQTIISPISTNPPLRRIRVDCIWKFKGGELITNTIETCRAPKQ